MYYFFKRILDILIALSALLILLPLLIPVMIILLFSGEREVFYFQKRIGQFGKPFFIWKFATMIKNSPNIGNAEITLKNDPRVTQVGKFLRKTKINELPQIVNVIKGEMSIVGPRPLMEVSYNLYSTEQQAEIYHAKPGITGIGSLIFRDEERILSSSSDPRKTYQSIFPYKASLEIWYRKKASIPVDLMIIMLTALALIFPNKNFTEKIFKDLPCRPKHFGM
jgi:lipopolysaccharide/colanic/teichoic acid biosynthesis glycosyltransferase